MATLRRRKHTDLGVVPPEVSAADAMAKRADMWLLIGGCLAGSLFLGLIGAPMVMYGLWLLRRAEKQGATIRPWIVTILGVWMLVDAAANLFCWGTDLLPAHDTVLGVTYWASYGRLADGAYYVHYNNLSAGGSAAWGEKPLEVLSVLILFPWRLAAAWAFIKMKRWGLQSLVITTWMYIFVWLAYEMNQVMDFPNRLGAALYGVVGYLAYNVFFLGPFVLIPYFYTVNREQWSE